MRIFTVGHGIRSIEELIELLGEAGVRTLIDVRRFPGSRRHPQFNQSALAPAVEAAGIAYRHAIELGGRRSGEPGEERFACIRVAAFRSYAARMGTGDWQDALAAALAEPERCFMCAETLWWRCHRRLIAELLDARGYEILHLLKPGHSERHRPWEPIAEVRDGVLHLCGEPVA
ncbi:MAG TPA: DUF488 domain-containing protein [Gaiellaceae bacterium]|nr:DUF488 domain-containing protein [Gaiellaceae bacterium]